MDNSEDLFNLVFRRTSTLSFRDVFHAHSQVELTYVHEGSGQLITDGKVFPIHSGMLIMLRPFQLHHVQIEVTRTQPFIRTVLMFEPWLLNDCLSRFSSLHQFWGNFITGKPGGVDKPVTSIPSNALLIQLLEQFVEYQEALSYPYTIESREEIQLFLLTLLRQLLHYRGKNYQATSNIEANPPLHPHTGGAIQWIEKHYAESFKLEDLATAIHLSPFHIAHLFKRNTGTTINSYTRATRVRHACVLLVSTTLNIPEIGHRVGMNSPSYFCKIFKKAIGLTPLQYRLKFNRMNKNLNT